MAITSHNAPGLPKQTRRSFLAAIPAIAVTAAPVAAATHWVAPTDENPELLLLGKKLPEIEQAYHDALAAWREAWRIWSPQWPLAPEPCCNKWSGSGYGRELERDLRGAGLRREGQSSAWTIKSAAEMERDIDRARAALAKDDKRKRSYGKLFRDYRHEEIAEAELGLILLPGYLAECERIKRESGFEEIEAARQRTAHKLFEFAREIVSVKSTTIEGVTIKASACAAVGRMRHGDVMYEQLTDSTTHEQPMAALLGQALLEVI